MTEQKYFINEYGKMSEVLEVYESFSGWYWFITEIDKEPSEAIDGTFGYVAYGFVRGFEDEWGEIWMPELEAEIKRGMVWKVPKSNWFGISNIITRNNSNG